jgi:hypothetical protein
MRVEVNWLINTPNSGHHGLNAVSINISELSDVNTLNVLYDSAKNDL